MKKAYLQLHAAVFLAGFTGILGYLIQLNGVVLIFYRFVITFLIMYGASIILKKPFKINPKLKPKVYFLGFLLTLHWIAFYQSIKLSNISISVVCLAASSCFTAIVHPFVQKRNFVWTELMLGLMGLCGIYIIYRSDFKHHLGILLGVTSSLLYSLITLYNKNFSFKIKPNTLLFYQFKIGILSSFVFIIVWLLIEPPKNLIGLVPTLSDFFWLILLSVFCTIFLQQLNLASLKVLSPFTNNLLFNLEMVYSIILAFVLFQEEHQLNLNFYLGTSLIIFSIGLQKLYVYYKNKKKCTKNKSNSDGDFVLSE